MSQMTKNNVQVCYYRVASMTLQLKQENSGPNLKIKQRFIYRFLRYKIDELRSISKYLIIVLRFKFPSL